mgnify:CR=1 FL=1
MTAYYFDNRFINELPGDPLTLNQPRQVLRLLFVRAPAADLVDAEV